MRRILAGGLAAALALGPAAASAQTADPTPALNASAMGISLSRIARRLDAESEARSDGVSPLKLEYHVDVFGNAPQLRFFTGQDLIYGAVPGSDMLNLVTPQAFRSPRVDFLSLVAGAAMYGAKKAQQWNYDRELEEYKKMVEAGKNVPAPKPPK
jgi:hypothetical protein